MNITIKRTLFLPDGIFSHVYDESGNQIGVCLEHSFADENGGWVPKVAAGTYNCVRHAPNRLPYETFMLEKVPDFQGQPVTGILIHKGNFNRDSEGCFLIGQQINPFNPDGSHDMVSNSAKAFDQFMTLQSGVNHFTLTVL